MELRKFIATTIREYLTESYNNDNIFYHGSTDKNLAGKNGIHVGTKLAATQALQARIGVPAEGEWDGTREYCKTLLAGKNTLKNKYNELGYSCNTGFNCGEVVLRDMNAAVNIKSFALKNHLSVERRLKNHGQLPTLVGAFTHEAHPIGSAVGG